MYLLSSRFYEGVNIPARLSFLFFHKSFLMHSAIYHLLLALLPALTYAQKPNNHVAWYAGYKTIHTTDSSRLYKPGVNTSHPLYYRPVDMDIWYPATKPDTGTAMIYKDFLSLFVNRPNFYSDTITPAGAINETAKAFCD